jgi:hypothetical protein
MFARLRGVDEDQIKSVVIDLLHIMMLTQYADKECETYRPTYLQIIITLHGSNWIFIGTLYDTDFVSSKHLEEL